jgi:uncharacterized membrane protein YeaQ/YmgE (transglycosylase-associated protein family)
VIKELGLWHAACFFSVRDLLLPVALGGEAMTLTLTWMDFFVLLLIAGLCGALGQVISGVSRGGLIVSIALGFIGALIGMWIARAMELPEPFPVRVGESGTTFPIIWSIVGSALFLVVLSLFRAPWRRRYYD